nr:OmpA family protein [Enterocloster bolteae]
MNEIGIDGVTVSRGEDYTFIVFEDKTFFDGDSSILTDQGKTTLDVFCDVIGPAQDGVSQINIMAHTAQGDPDRPNNPRTDRMLSAMRAAEVCIFIQEKGVIKPEKLVNISYGQFRPVADNSTREGRTKNRRVEILMIDEGADLHSMNRYYDEYNSGVNADRTVVTGQGQDADGSGHGFAPAAPSADGVSTTMSPATDIPESASAEPGFPSGDTAKETGGTAAE